MSPGKCSGITCCSLRNGSQEAFGSSRPTIDGSLSGRMKLTAVSLREGISSAGARGCVRLRLWGGGLRTSQRVSLSLAHAADPEGGRIMKSRIFLRGWSVTLLVLAGLFAAVVPSAAVGGPSFSNQTPSTLSVVAPGFITLSVQISATSKISDVSMSVNGMQLSPEVAGPSDNEQTASIEWPFAPGLYTVTANATANGLVGSTSWTFDVVGDSTSSMISFSNYTPTQTSIVVSGPVSVGVDVHLDASLGSADRIMMVLDGHVVDYSVTDSGADFTVYFVSSLADGSHQATIAVAAGGSVGVVTWNFSITNVANPTADSNIPVLSNLTPAPFSTSAPGEVTISASATSNSAITHISLDVSGVALMPVLTTVGDLTTASASTTLAAGTYTVTAKAVDSEGDAFTAQWDIVVSSNQGDSEWFNADGTAKSAQINATMRSLVEAFRWHLYGQEWDANTIPDMPTHATTYSVADPLSNWVTNGTFDANATNATLKSLVEAFRWHFFAISWDLRSHCEIPTHANCNAPLPPQPIAPWFDSNGNAIPANITATLRSLVEAFRWHFWGYSWDGSQHFEMPSHAWTSES